MGGTFVEVDVLLGTTVFVIVFVIMGVGVTITTPLLCNASKYDPNPELLDHS